MEICTFCGKPEKQLIKADSAFICAKCILFLFEHFFSVEEWIPIKEKETTISMFIKGMADLPRRKATWAAIRESLKKLSP